MWQAALTTTAQDRYSATRCRGKSTRGLDARFEGPYSRRMVTLSQWISAQRSHAAAARELGVSPSTVSLLIRHRRRPGWALWVRARDLGLDLAGTVDEYRDVTSEAWTRPEVTS